MFRIARLKFFLMFFLCVGIKSFSQAQENKVLKLFFDTFKTDTLENGVVLTYDEPYQLNVAYQKPLKLILYALPNGGTMENVFGRKVFDESQYVFESQHIGSQTRFVRMKDTSHLYVVVYIGNQQKSWPAWVKSRKEAGGKPEKEIAHIVHQIQTKYTDFQTSTYLTGHSGGGRFLFSWIDAYKNIPSTINRIVFFDATYGYETKKHKKKIQKWLHNSPQNRLDIFAYNDSVVVFQGKPLVSPKGGTWYRSQLMAKDLGLKTTFSDSTQWILEDTKQVEIRLLRNPEGLIYHSVLVERNGFIYSILKGTKWFDPSWYWANRVYSEYILKTWPKRMQTAKNAIELAPILDQLSPKERDSLVTKEILNGNSPAFLWDLKPIHGSLYDNDNQLIQACYWVIRDYLSLGSDENFLRFPLEPKSAQRIGDALGFFLSTSKISDEVYQASETKFEPFPLTENRDLLATFYWHNKIIEEQRLQMLGQSEIPNTLMAGHKKDVISTSQLSRTLKPNRVALYGWHQPNGKPIQPIYTGHVDWYIDYSHGFRLVWNYILINGQFLHVNEVFENPILRPILTYEIENKYFRY